MCYNNTDNSVILTVCNVLVLMFWVNVVYYSIILYFYNRRRGAIIDVLSVKNDIQLLHSVSVYAVCDCTYENVFCCQTRIKESLFVGITVYWYNFGCSWTSRNRTTVSLQWWWNFEVRSYNWSCSFKNMQPAAKISIIPGESVAAYALTDFRYLVKLNCRSHYHAN